MDDGLLTVDQASASYDVSPLTLRRRAQYGEIEGAVKVRGRRGQEWRMPAASLERLGYARRAETVADLDELLTTVRRLSELLAESQRENARLNRELGGAVAEAARLRGQLKIVAGLSSVRPRSPEVVDLRVYDASSRASAD